ncbi:MAG TPA: DUF3426 domain-containing protein [Burkholderiales bacterium]|nr:DUF3426 domain-containing protein [Burkholderiales bacterium]
MSLITKCTSCGTTFRVTEPQLQAHGGKVRCGTCMTVFDGVQALVTLPDAAVEAPRKDAAGEPGGFKLEPDDPSAAAPPPETVHVSPPARETDDYGPSPEQLSLDDQLYVEERRRGAKAWAAGAVVLAFALGAQAVHLYRGDVAAHYPVLKPHLAQACDWLRCTVSPPQRPRQIAIEASDLQATDKARPGLIQLTATMRNHAGHDVGYPALDLVLTNTKEHTLARRIFLPREYLDGGREVAAGIPASAELTVRLDLDTGDLNPAGFRLDLLPAPAP